ncbi:hypothetical protein Tco_0242715 [Tanacetum coccineum]
MPYPRFAKIIINHFLKQHKTLTNLNHKHQHTIKDDGIVSRLKFVRIGEDYQEYGLPILGVMLTEAIKRSESYQMFIKYSTNLTPPKKSREPEPEPAKKKTASRRVVKKKVTLSADDNIISDDPDAALELAKSISKTEDEEAARKVHATHAQIVTESVPKSAKKKSSGRSSKSVVIQDTSSAPKSKPATSKTKLKVICATLSEGTGAKPWVPNEDKEITEEKVILELGDEQDSEFFDDDNNDAEKDEMDGDADDEGDDHISDTQDANDEDVETKFDEDDIYKYKIHVRKDKDVEMKDAEVEGSDKGDEEITDAAKVEVEKTLEAKDDTKKIELPPSSSSLYVSSSFGDRFLKLSSDSSLVSTVRDSAYADVIAKLEKDVSELKTGDHSSVALVVLQSYVPTVVDSYLDTKVGDVFQKELQKHTAYLIHIYSLQHLPELTKKPTPTTEQESEKIPSDIIKITREQAKSQKNLQFTINSTDKTALKAYDLKSALYQSMHASKSFNKNPANHRLYHALMKALIEDENVMDKGVADTVKDHKRKHDDDEEDDDEDPPARPNQGKAPTKGSKTGKSASVKEPVEEPIAEVIMDDAGDDVARDDNLPQVTLETKTRKILNPEWFKQPPMPPTPDPE